MFCQEVFQLSDTWDKTIIFPLIHCYTVFAPAPIELKEKENHLKTKMSNKTVQFGKNGLCITLNHLQQSFSHKYKCTCFILSITASRFLSYLFLLLQTSRNTSPHLCWEQFPGTRLPQTNYRSTKYQNMLSKFSTLSALYSIQKQINV